MSCRKFYYPPHAGSRHKIRRADLEMYESLRDTYFAQRKYNGTSCVIYLANSQTFIWDRHHNELTLYKLQPSMAWLLHNKLKIDSHKEYVLNGEILHHKAVSDVTGAQAALNTIVLYDLLYCDGYLDNVPAQERYDMLFGLCNCPLALEKKSRGLLIGDEQESHLWLANIFGKNFLEVFDEMNDYHAKTGADKWPEIEGLMLKQRRGMLLSGDSETDVQWIVKCRKEKENMFRF